jgi:hypothetical protein
MEDPTQPMFPVSEPESISADFFDFKLYRCIHRRFK